MKKQPTLWILIGRFVEQNASFSNSIREANGNDPSYINTYCLDITSESTFVDFVEDVENGKEIILFDPYGKQHIRKKYIECCRYKNYKIKFVVFTTGRLPSYDPESSLEYDEIMYVGIKNHAKILDIRQICEDKRTIVVGDIHGCFDTFLALLQKCNYTENDVVVSVGDLTDRGPKSKEVLSWFRKTQSAYVTQGNHCNKLKRYWQGSNVTINHGLDKTIEQTWDNKGAMAQVHSAWIETWPHIIRLPDIGPNTLWVVHAGINGCVPIDYQKMETCLYARYLGGKDFFDEECGEIWWKTLCRNEIIVSGHIVSENPHPCEKAYCIDGGCGRGGKLRALVIDNSVIQMIETDQTEKEKDS